MMGGACFWSAKCCTLSPPSHPSPVGATGFYWWVKWLELKRWPVGRVWAGHEDSSTASSADSDCSPGHPTSCVRFSWDQSPSPTLGQLFCSHVPSCMAGGLNLDTPDRSITGPWTPNARPTLLDWASESSHLAWLYLSSHGSWASRATAKAIPTLFHTINVKKFCPSCCSGICKLYIKWSERGTIFFLKQHLTKGYLCNWKLRTLSPVSVGEERSIFSSLLW